MITPKTTIRSGFESVVVQKTNLGEFAGALAIGLGAIALASWPILSAIRSGGSFGGMGLYDQSLVAVVGGIGALLIVYALFFLPIRERFAFDTNGQTLDYFRKFVFGSQIVRRPLDEVRVRTWSVRPRVFRSFRLDLSNRGKPSDRIIDVIGLSLTYDRGLSATETMAKCLRPASDQAPSSMVTRIRDTLQRAGIEVAASDGDHDSRSSSGQTGTQSIPWDSPLLPEAFSLWIGRNRSSYPNRDDSLIYDRYSDDLAPRILDAVYAIYDEYHRSRANAFARDLIEMADMATAEFKEKHSEVSDQIITDLEWSYTFQHK